MRRYAWFIGSWSSEEDLRTDLLPKGSWSEPDVRNLCQNTMYSTVKGIFLCFRTIIRSFIDYNAAVTFGVANQKPDSGIVDNLFLLRVYELPFNLDGELYPATIDHPLGWVHRREKQHLRT